MFSSLIQQIFFRTSELESLGYFLVDEAIAFCLLNGEDYAPTMRFEEDSSHTVLRQIIADL
ncbi:hypothetical protein [Candidatus Lokiarchaeum ossiferum]|uniref:hypothetical protein n=1 Tax=Candidatus Lokiarchaeum ossiferum TaxID=2951803 RepID=UPI00352D8C9C